MQVPIAEKWPRALKPLLPERKCAPKKFEVQMKNSAKEPAKSGSENLGGVPIDYSREAGCFSSWRARTYTQPA
jgi:hypothetical protein